MEWLFITEPSETELLPALSGIPPSILLSSPCSDLSETRSCLRPVTDKNEFWMRIHGTANHFLVIEAHQRTKSSNKMRPSIITHPFTQDYHHHAGAYCGSNHHIAGFHSDSVSSSIDHLKPAEREELFLHILNLHARFGHWNWTVLHPALVYCTRTGWVFCRTCVTVRSFHIATDYVWSLTINRALVLMVSINTLASCSCSLDHFLWCILTT